MKIEDWLEDQKTVVVDEAALARVLLCDVGGDTWHTWPASVTADQIEGRLSELRAELPNGTHTVKLQAVDTRGVVRAQLLRTISATNSTAKAGVADFMAIAKATQITVDTQESQLRSMAARAEAAEARARDAEARNAEMAEQFYQMYHVFRTQTREEKREEIELAEAAARIEGVKTLAFAAAPAFGKFVEAFAESPLGQSWMQKLTGIGEVKKEKEPPAKSPEAPKVETEPSVNVDPSPDPSPARSQGRPERSPEDEVSKPPVGSGPKSAGRASRRAAPTKSGRAKR